MAVAGALEEEAAPQFSEASEDPNSYLESVYVDREGELPGLWKPSFHFANHQCHVVTYVKFEMRFYVLPDGLETHSVFWKHIEIWFI